MKCSDRDWRDVDAKLPEDGQVVIGFDGESVVPTCYLEDIGWLDLTSEFGTAEFACRQWLPLPQKPTERGKDEQE